MLNSGNVPFKVEAHRAYGFGEVNTTLLPFFNLLIRVPTVNHFPFRGKNSIPA